MKKIFSYFFKGLLIILPIGLTIFIILRAVKWLNALFNVGIPGLGILIALVAITMIGMLFSGIIGNFIFGFFDRIILKTPVVNTIYSSLKDLMEAFVGEKKKFTEPVLIELYPNGVQALGFITKKDLQAIQAVDKVAVYLPFSYSFAGHLLIVPIDKIKNVDANSTEIMRFLISAGITGL
jgi:uncharacterized membrane protein